MAFVNNSKIKLSNPRQSELVPIELTCLVDTGALMLCIPQTVAFQLGLEQLDKRPVTIADGSSHQVPYVGPIRVDFGNRFCFTGALVIGDETLYRYGICNSPINCTITATLSALTLLT